MTWIPVQMDKGWLPDFIEYGVPEGGLTECKNRLPLDDRYAPMPDKQVYSQTAVGSTTFTGSGLDDGTFGGTYTGTTEIVYKAVIVADGVTDPNTFDWYKDGVKQNGGTPVDITGAAQTLDNGITITFGATTGHTAADYWEATAYPAVTSDSPRNAQQFLAADGVNYLFVGTSTKLHRMSGTNKYFDDVSKAGGYSTGSNMWSFLQYGDWVIATNYVNNVQVMDDMDTDTAFADLGGSPPKAKYLLFHKGHVILGNVNDGAVKPRRIVWSGLEDPTTWTASLTTGADGQTFPDSGEITGLANVQDSFAILHRNSISVGRYSGAPYTFEFEHNRVKNIGCEYPGSAISIGDRVFFWGNDDIYEFDGASARGIGLGVKDTIIPNVDTTYSYRITAMHDESLGIVFWAWPNTSTTDGNFTRILAYNYRVRRFSWLEVSGECIFGFRQGAQYAGANFETATDVYTEFVAGVTPANSVVLTGYADSSAFLSGAWVFASMNTSNQLCTHDSNYLTGIIATGEVKLNDDVVMVQRMRPRAAQYVTAPMGRVGSRMDENDVVEYTANTTVGSNGYIDLRSSGRYFRTELTLGDDSGVFDLEVDLITRGKR